jgi:hypothetical protein
LATTIQTLIKTDPYNYGSTSVQIRFRGGSYAANTSDWQALQQAYVQNPTIQQDGNWGGSLPWSQLAYYDPCVNRFQGVLCFEGRIYQLQLSGTISYNE